MSLIQYSLVINQNIGLMSGQAWISQSDRRRQWPIARKTDWPISCYNSTNQKLVSGRLGSSQIGQTIVLGPNQMSLSSGWAKPYIYIIVCMVNIRYLRYDSLFIGAALYTFWPKKPFFRKTQKPHLNYIE